MIFHPNQLLKHIYLYLLHSQLLFEIHQQFQCNIWARELKVP